MTTSLEFVAPLSAAEVDAYRPRVLPSFDAPTTLPTRVLPSFDAPSGRVIPLLDDPRVLPSFDAPMPLDYFTTELDASSSVVESSPIFDALDREWVALSESVEVDDLTFAEDESGVEVCGQHSECDYLDVCIYAAPFTPDESAFIEVAARNGAGFLEVAYRLISQQRISTSRV